MTVHFSVCFLLSHIKSQAKLPGLPHLMLSLHTVYLRYGRKAIELALEFIKTFPCGRAEYCWLSYEPDNKVAKNLYESFGFEETGEMDGEEIIAVLKL